MWKVDDELGAKLACSVSTNNYLEGRSIALDLLKDKGMMLANQHFAWRIWYSHPIANSVTMP